MKIRQTSAARQVKTTHYLTSDSTRTKSAHDTGKPLASARETALHSSQAISSPGPRHRREPTIEDLLADPSLCVWSTWK